MSCKSKMKNNKKMNLSFLKKIFRITSLILIGFIGGFGGSLDQYKNKKNN